MTRDDFTVTVDGAAGHAAHHAEPAHDDRPTRAEIAADEWHELHDDDEGDDE